MGLGHLIDPSRSLSSILRERHRQDAKWGEQNHDPFGYLAILVEEVGEFSQAALHDRFHDPRDGDTTKSREKLRDEAVQVAAVAMAIVECLDRGKWRWPSETGSMTKAEMLDVAARLGCPLAEDEILKRLGLPAKDETTSTGMLSAAALEKIKAAPLFIPSPQFGLCACDLRARAWNPSTKKCETCGASYVSPGDVILKEGSPGSGRFA